MFVGCNSFPWNSQFLLVGSCTCYVDNLRRRMYEMHKKIENMHSKEVFTIFHFLSARQIHRWTHFWKRLTKYKHLKMDFER